MDVKTILAAKGGSAFFLKPDSPVSEAIKLMNDKRIGAVLVREDEEAQIQGILLSRKGGVPVV